LNSGFFIEVLIFEIPIVRSGFKINSNYLVPIVLVFIEQKAF
jgi:hypothetical protein